jgi:hypothetical protein
LIKEHHPGYLSWDEYERNQVMIAANAHMHSGGEPKAGRGGTALLSGLCVVDVAEECSRSFIRAR